MFPWGASSSALVAREPQKTSLGELQYDEEILFSCMSSSFPRLDSKKKDLFKAKE